MLRSGCLLVGLLIAVAASSARADVVVHWYEPADDDLVGCEFTLYGVAESGATGDPIATLYESALSEQGGGDERTTTFAGAGPAPGKVETYRLGAWCEDASGRSEVVTVDATFRGRVAPPQQIRLSHR